MINGTKWGLVERREDSEAVETLVKKPPSNTYAGNTRFSCYQTFQSLKLNWEKLKCMILSRFHYEWAFYSLILELFLKQIWQRTFFSILVTGYRLEPPPKTQIDFLLFLNTQVDYTE